MAEGTVHSEGPPQDPLGVCLLFVITCIHHIVNHIAEYEYEPSFSGRSGPSDVVESSRKYAWDFVFNNVDLAYWQL